MRMLWKGSEKINLLGQSILINESAAEGGFMDADQVAGKSE